MKLENTRYGEYELLMEDLTQGDVEKFFRTLRQDYPDGADTTSIEFQGNSVRVANKLGWLSPKIDDVDKSSPKLVRVIAMEINKILAEALEIDPS